MPKTRIFVLTALIWSWAIFAAPGHARDFLLSRVQPAGWWIGMQDPMVQLMAYGSNLSATQPRIDVPGLAIKEVHRTENPDYLFIDLEIGLKARPGMVPIRFFEGGVEVARFDFSLMERKAGALAKPRFSQADVLYLVMPDRFSNGDPANDTRADFLQAADRTNPDGRHGGDLKGLRNHLDYIANLGFTSLWITPILENNTKPYSYHGYGATDLYSVDPRMGTLADYTGLIEDCHRRNLKVLMDVVLNHCADTHWWMANPPTSDWFNRWPAFTQTNYRGSTLTDPHASAHDRARMVKGWFVRQMPDLNQNNPFVARYLIQNTIWWIETADIDGIRLDTQMYPEKEFISAWYQAINQEYPGFFVVGEAWLSTPLQVSYFQGGTQNTDGYDSGLPAVFDFPLYDEIKQSLNEEDGWSSGVAGLYDLLAQDFTYPRPWDLVTFLDNHDVNRIFSNLGEDVSRLQMALTFLLTTRGIPQVYYGTELLFTGTNQKGDGALRKDFPGGWPGDSLDAFSGRGLRPEQIQTQKLVHDLLHYRKTSPCLSKGQLTHFVPSDGVYVFFRSHENQVLMVILNHSRNPYAPDLDRFAEFTRGHARARDILRGTSLPLENIRVEPGNSAVLELESPPSPK